MAKRRFNLEASLHLYSSGPAVMTPADLYDAARDANLRDAFVGTNIYLIVSRPRIVVDARSIQLQGRLLTGHFHVMREEGWASVPFQYVLEPDVCRGEPLSDGIAVAPNGTRVCIQYERGHLFIAAHVLVSQGQAELLQTERDLQVLYVGQGVGRHHERLAMDRLLKHSTLQRILADFHTWHPEWEVLLLFYRFEHARMMFNTGGDLNLPPTASAEEERTHVARVRQATIGRRERISLAEAALIHYFQPEYNTVFRRTHFADAAKKRKFLASVMRKDLVGLIVELGAWNLGARLYSPERKAHAFDEAVLAQIAAMTDGIAGSDRRDLDQLLMTHVIGIPLTHPHERDSFLHGMRWKDADVTVPWL